MARLSVTINGEQRTFALTEQGIQIGRALDNDIVLNNAIVSRRHARVELRGRDAWVADEGSRNGISVNRLRVKEERLDDGDVIDAATHARRADGPEAEGLQDGVIRLIDGRGGLPGGLWRLRADHSV